MNSTSKLTVTCEVLSSSQVVQDRRDELAQFAESAEGATHIVQHPDWILYELESREQTTLPYLVVARNEENQVIGYAPFLREKRSARIRFGKLGITVYRGWMLRMLGSEIVTTAGERDVAEQAIARALREDKTIRVIYIQETALPNSLATVLSHGAGRFSSLKWNLLDQINWLINPQESISSYIDELGSRRSNHAYRERKVYKKLGEEAQLRVFEKPGEIETYCRLMNQLYARTWHAEVKSIDWELPALQSLFVRLAKTGKIIGHILMQGERPIAYVHGYRMGGRYVLDDTGYDKEYASLGVGSVLVFQAIKDLIERYPNELIDFGYGDNEYKRRLATGNMPCGSVFSVRGIWPFLGFHTIVPMRWLYRFVRRLKRS